jgi:cell division protein FtsX
MNSIMKTIGGIVTIVIAFILFPIILDSTATILADANIANYTGLSSLVKVAPLLIFVGMLFGGGMLSWTGARSIRKG